jgi:sulfite reductase alpha subunit-like flavoprotein
MEEREIAQAKGEELGEALLYFGCREKDSDYIYRDEMA